MGNEQMWVLRIRVTGSKRGWDLKKKYIVQCPHEIMKKTLTDYREVSPLISERNMEARWAWKSEHRHTRRWGV